LMSYLLHFLKGHVCSSN